MRFSTMALLQITTILLVAVAMAAAMAHALEYPGKMRLTKEQYEVMQLVYYPGFTIAGATEPLSIIALGVMAALTPEIIEFWLVIGALLAMFAMHGVFWLMTQPVNKRWMRKAQISGASETFFKKGPSAALSEDNWREARDQWERSHILRAVLSFIALALLVVSACI